MLKVVIAGGSISGLCAGIALRGVGCSVEIHERTSGAMTSRGAGIVAQPQLLRLVRSVGAPEIPTTSCLYRRHLLPDDGDEVTRTERPLQFTSWSAIHRTLKSAFPANRYHQGSSLIGFNQTAGCVVAHFPDGYDVEADLLVGADGSRSEMRRKVAAEAQPNYAGYVAWRGTIEEADAPAELVRFFDQSFTICEGRSGGHILCYFIPGAGAATEAGARLLNWVWYVRVPRPELEKLLTDKNGVAHEASLTAGMVPLDRIAEIHALAARELHPRFVDLVQRTPDPFLQAIIDVAVPRMAEGRVCLVGDAAFVLRPHPGAATAKAAADAMGLAAALNSHSGDLPAALRAWNARQLEYGNSLAELATMLGKRSVEYSAASRDETDLAERFQGISPLLPLTA